MNMPVQTNATPTAPAVIGRQLDRLAVHVGRAAAPLAQARVQAKRLKQAASPDPGLTNLLVRRSIVNLDCQRDRVISELAYFHQQYTLWTRGEMSPDPTLQIQVESLNQLFKNFHRQLDVILRVLNAVEDDLSGTAASQPLGAGATMSI